MIAQTHGCRGASRTEQLTERLRSTVTDFNESDDPLDRAALMQRIRALRAEIAAAEAKVHRMRESIAARRNALNRMDARLAMSGARPSRREHG